MQTVELGETQPVVSNDPELVHVAIGRASVDCSLVLLASILVKIVVYACLISIGPKTWGKCFRQLDDRNSVERFPGLRFRNRDVHGTLLVPFS